MNPHFFTAPFYFAFIWFRVQGSGFSWRLRRLFLEDGILVSQPSPLGNAIKLSGRTFLAPHRGSSPKGEARRYVANDFLNFNSITLEGKAQRRGGWGTSGMKVREGMRIKQAIHGSSQAPVFVNGDARKWHSSHQSREVLNP